MVINGWNCTSAKEFQEHSNVTNDEIVLLILKYGEIK